MRRLLIVALVWGVELFLLQALSFHFDYPVPLLKRVGAVTIRLVLDLAFAVGVVMVLPRLATAVVFFLFLLFVQVGLFYQAVFGRVISLSSARMQWSEGVSVLHFEPSYVNLALLAVSLLFLVYKLWLLHWSRGEWRLRLWLGGGALTLYAVLLAVSMGFVDSPRKLQTFVSGDRFGMTYGFLPLWVSEALYLDSDSLLQEAVAKREQATDRLAGVEPLFPLQGDVVIVQVESLDWRILHHKSNEREVTPFLNRLAEEAMLFKVAAFHDNGSGDADFVMLNGVPPSPSVMTYTLSHYPYKNTLAQRAVEAGYKTTALHGNSGNFFSRRHNFRKIGFEQVLFMEELRDYFQLPLSRWGVRDDDVLRLSGRILTGECGAVMGGVVAAEGGHGELTPQLHYIITLTSHQPFNFLESDEQQFLPGAVSLVERYYNSINFVDRQLQEYVAGLAEGTVLVVFGDHRAMVAFGESQGRVELVPFIIHQVGSRLAEVQVTREMALAISGELTMVDTALYVHRLFVKPGEE